VINNVLYKQPHQTFNIQNLIVCERRKCSLGREKGKLVRFYLLHSSENNDSSKRNSSSHRDRIMDMDGGGYRLLCSRVQVKP
jgi:hypothetical protein